MNDDAQLIAETLAGHAAAFGHLVEKYQDRLYNTVVYLLGNREDAKDVVQEALVQAFLKLASFQGASAFYTWVYRIAFNVAATHRRRRSAMRSAEHAHGDGGGRAADGPEQRIDRDEQCRQVRDAIARLGEEQRSVLVLREIDGHDYATIAEILDLPVGTVRSRLHRGTVASPRATKTSSDDRPVNDAPLHELLSAYLDGELTAAERAGVEQILATDPQARQWLDELRALSHTLRALPRYKPDEDLSRPVLEIAERRMLTGSSSDGAATTGPQRASAPARLPTRCNRCGRLRGRRQPRRTPTRAECSAVGPCSGRAWPWPSPW